MTSGPRPDDAADVGVPKLADIVRQLGSSQWWSPMQLEAHVFRRLGILASYAAERLPWYASRLAEAGFRPDGTMTRESWERVPILTRGELRDAGRNLLVANPPAFLGGVGTVSSGGSTGIPVRVSKTALDQLIWSANHLREVGWHSAEFSGELVNMRGVSKDFMEASRIRPGVVADGAGLILPDWGAPCRLFRKTGRMGILQPDRPLPEQAEFLRIRRPVHLLMRPAALRLLLAYHRENGLSLDSLRSVWTMSEIVDESLRDECRAVFGCPVRSNYSAGEAGYLAVQCPSGTNYHAMSETVHVEVVDESGKPCRPGGIGRVLVTPLYNFAMPLIRYEIGDEAEVGPPCGCGRGLPSLTRIVGRTEDYFTLPSGGRMRVDLSHYRISAVEAVREFQLVQTSPEEVELRVVTAGRDDDPAMEELGSLMDRSFGRHFRCRVARVDSLPRTPSGKLRQFVSEVGKR